MREPPALKTRVTADSARTTPGGRLSMYQRRRTALPCGLCESVRTVQRPSTTANRRSWRERCGADTPLTRSPSTEIGRRKVIALTVAALELLAAALNFVRDESQRRGHDLEFTLGGCLENRSGSLVSSGLASELGAPTSGVPVTQFHQSATMPSMSSMLGRCSELGNTSISSTFTLTTRPVSRETSVP